MAQFPEQPPLNNDKREITPEEAETIRKWYFDTSHQGRTGAEFNALREEARKANTVDFVKMRDDLDYGALMYENPHVQEFMRDMTVFDLERIYEHRDDIGMSGEQFERLLAIFDKDVKSAFRKSIADGEAMTDLHKKIKEHFSVSEIKEHSEESLAAMKKEIELQEQNLAHEPVKLSFFPKKKRP